MTSPVNSSSSLTSDVVSIFGQQLTSSQAFFAPTNPYPVQPGSAKQQVFYSSTGVQQAASITFASVTAAGATTLTPLISSSAGYIALPAGYGALAAPVYYDVATTASYAGSINVCLTHVFSTPVAPWLFHYSGGSWTNVTTSTNTGTRTVCGQAPSLSPFTLLAELPPTTAPTRQPTTAPSRSPTAAPTPTAVTDPIRITAGGSSSTSSAGCLFVLRVTLKLPPASTMRRGLVTQPQEQDRLPRALSHTVPLDSTDYSLRVSAPAASVKYKRARVIPRLKAESLKRPNTLPNGDLVWPVVPMPLYNDQASKRKFKVRVRLFVCSCAFAWRFQEAHAFYARHTHTHADSVQGAQEGHVPAGVQCLGLEGRRQAGRGRPRRGASTNEDGDVCVLHGLLPCTFLCVPC